jgi:RimJ/RimL family protein N-acetyltransferase
MLHFRELETPRVISLVHSDNVASSRVAEKIGMTMKQQITFRGFPAKMFSLSRDRWLALSGV